MKFNINVRKLVSFYDHFVNELKKKRQQLEKLFKVATFLGKFISFEPVSLLKAVLEKSQLNDNICTINQSYPMHIFLLCLEASYYCVNRIFNAYSLLNFNVEISDFCQHFTKL